MTWDTVWNIAGVILGLAIGLWAILVLEYLRAIRDHLEIIKRQRR